MKVLHVHKISGIGGSERHLLTLLPALRARGIDARFLGLEVEDSDAPRFFSELEEAGVPFARVRCSLDVSPRLAVAVTRAVRRAGPDLLHTHLVHGDVYGSLAAAALHVPLVSSRHNDDRYLLGPVPVRRPCVRVPRTVDVPERTEQVAVVVVTRRDQPHMQGRRCQ